MLLTWRPLIPAPGVTYNVYRSPTTPVPLDPAHRIAQGLRRGFYLDRGGRAGLYYVVTAQNAWGESGPSNTAQARRPGRWPFGPGRGPEMPLLWPDPLALLPAPLLLVALGRGKRRMRGAAPLGAALLAVAALSIGAALLSGGAGAEEMGSAGAEVLGSAGAEGMLTRVITYTYDPLHRLTGAYYSTGESFEYAYDAVGNRTAYTATTPLAGTVVTTYTYDAANRLRVSASPGHLVSYGWDARGNLTYDGVFTYTYDAAGHLVRAQSITATLHYTYTADGLRVAQSSNGTLTTFAWDWAAPVPEVLRAGEVRYLVGAETLGEWAAAWAYYLPDALGSVRQAVDGAGALQWVRAWEPYGVELALSGAEGIGDAQAGLGFTGEWYDPGLGMLYLRARWYAPGIGIFSSPDPFPGLQIQPRSMHPYLYALDNPIHLTDPTGHTPFPPIPINNPLTELLALPAWQVVDRARKFYSKQGDLRVCPQEDDGQHPSDTVDDLLTDFICEFGPDHRYFYADAHLTQQLARSYTIHLYRIQFYLQDHNVLTGQHVFETSAFLLATLDSLAEGDQTRFRIHIPQLNITHFLGSFEYRIAKLQTSDWIQFWVHNTTDLASGTRIPRILGGRPEARSLEKLIKDYPNLRDQSFVAILLSYGISSILEAKERQETQDPQGGGKMEQTFLWCERPPQIRICGLPLPQPLPFLNLPLPEHFLKPNSIYCCT